MKIKIGSLFLNSTLRLVNFTLSYLTSYVAKKTTKSVWDCKNQASILTRKKYKLLQIYKEYVNAATFFKFHNLIFEALLM
jgi:hypothetical protein